MHQEQSESKKQATTRKMNPRSSPDHCYNAGVLVSTARDTLTATASVCALGVVECWQDPRLESWLKALKELGEQAHTKGRFRAGGGCALERAGALSGKQRGKGPGTLGEHHKRRPRLVVWVLVEVFAAPTLTLRLHLRLVYKKPPSKP